MNRLNQVLLFLHFLGLTMGFATSFANMAMAGLIAKAAPPEKPVLGRFPPAMSGIGLAGLVLLWASGLILVYTKYGGPASLPPTFLFKLAAVILLTITVLYIHSLERRIQKGDMAAARSIETFGKVSMSLALLAVVFAVVTFD